VIIQATTQASGIERFVPVGIATKLLVSLGVGLLVGFEREWSHKDLGVRTFALVSLLGMLTTLASPPFAWIGMAAVVLLVTGLNVGHVLLRREVEATTAVALVVTFVLGVLVGDGHVFTPTASAILMTLLLAVKPQLTRFAGGITAEEIRGAVLLGLIGFVIYPVLPNRPVDPWSLVNPREVWLTVILIAGIGFVNYVLLRVYSTRGLYYTALFGGLVNSTATIAELGETTRDTGEKQRVIITLTLITVIAMYVRNLAIVATFSPSSGLIALAPIAAMCVFTSAVVFRMRQTADEGVASRLSSPISFRKIGSFGLFFLGVQALATLAQRFLGTAGSVAVSFLGGFVSSASATAAAGTLTAHHEMTPRIAAICTVMASIASALVNLPLIYRTSRGAGVFRRLILLSALTTMIGVAVLVTVLLSLK
jgi:uncharacterized membrane protein (DUF4010 family)